MLSFIWLCQKPLEFNILPCIRAKSSSCVSVIATCYNGKRWEIEKKKGTVIKLLFIYTSIIFLRVRGKSFRDGWTFLPCCYRGCGICLSRLCSPKPLLVGREMYWEKSSAEKAWDLFEWSRVVKLSAGLLLLLAWLFAVTFMKSTATGILSGICRKCPEAEWTRCPELIICSTEESSEQFRFEWAIPITQGHF